MIWQLEKRQRGTTALLVTVKWLVTVGVGGAVIIYALVKCDGASRDH